MSVSRRDFLKTSGALIVSFSAAPLARPLAFVQGPFDTHPSHVDPKKLDSWIAVSADGTVIAYTGKCDFGQGMFTVQTQLVAEELCVPLARVKLIQCDTSVAPDQGTTSGSQSTPTNFNSENLAQAAATAREALINMAASKFDEPADQLTVADGVVTGESGRKITYAELIGSKRFDLPLSMTAKRRSPSQWTVLGKPVCALETAALMTGQFEFVHNVRVPGMLHGRVVRPPEVGATVASVDEESVKQIPGLVKVVARNNFVGVVAEKQSQAIQAARQLKVKWNPGPGLPAQKTFFETLRKQPGQDSLLVDSKDVEQQLAAAPTVVRATYVYPYQMHGSVGASCAVADVKPDRTTVWSATQSVYPTRSIVAKILGLPLESVRVTYVRGSGCYGLNGADTVSIDAALLSQAVGKPVRVQLSRQDEMAWENYGAACVIEQRAGIGNDQKITAWDCETWSTSKGGRPGYDRPGNVVSGMLMGDAPEEVKPRPATEPRNELRNRSNMAPSYIAGCVNGNCRGAGTIRSERVLTHTVASPFFTGPLRSPLRIQNTFAHECFMDELSASAKADPVAFRLQHLSDPRLIDVLKAAARAAHWETRPSPNANLSRSGTVTGRGIACVVYEGNNGYAATVAEVSVDLESGLVTPKRFSIAVDSGPISNPDGLRNQTEGGTLQGMSRALVEEVTWDDKRVTSTDWETYKSLYLDLELPTVDITLINRADVPATGAGETAITLVPAAIGNAIFDATGIRLREVPFTAQRVQAALHAGTQKSRQQIYGPTQARQSMNWPRRSWILMLALATCSLACGWGLKGVAANAKQKAGTHIGAKTVQQDSAASAAAFKSIVPVFRHPRCMNCHSRGDFPRQGDDGHRHTMNVRRGREGQGVAGLRCSTCHQDHNLSGEHMPPGAPDWHLPSAGNPMIWEGLSDRQLCELLKDPAHNGHRTVDGIVKHMNTPLVLWGWHPGEGRTPVPLPESEFLVKVNEWASHGAACPGESN